MKAFYIGCILFLITSQMLIGQHEILLKDYDPVSIYNIPKTKVSKAKFPIIDMHSHPYAMSDEEIKEWVATMDVIGIEKTILLTYQTGKAFDSIYAAYSKHKGRFEIWCGFDFTGYDQKGWSQKAIRELERCYNVGARGVGELGDKGEGLLYSKPVAAYGMHIDDERMKPVLQKCGELGMPVNIHIAEPYWMYEPADVHNDGLMNAANWKVDMTKKNILSHQQLINTLENAVKEHPNTTFIACHFANCSYDLDRVGSLLEKYDNLYADISARYGETASVPKYTRAFYKKYQDKLLYGTDMGIKESMYNVTLRILETEDEHFYKKKLFNYHWPLYGFGLDDSILKKLYHENAKRILK
ncbi:amidohydrolase family protein [Aquimarina pacifica]|uniref:amidohydrolase family protein n=1 Tax=Aquimarina pacifica TaxID=1296415 RepID=UPI00046E9141|nr:amidohydrolase family protein [Aquimarina pacifica]